MTRYWCHLWHKCLISCICSMHKVTYSGYIFSSCKSQLWTNTFHLSLLGNERNAKKCICMLFEKLFKAINVDLIRPYFWRAGVFYSERQRKSSPSVRDFDWIKETYHIRSSCFKPPIPPYVRWVLYDWDLALCRPLENALQTIFFMKSFRECWLGLVNKNEVIQLLHRKIGAADFVISV